MCSFCAYQERTQQEVRDKLYALGGLSSDSIEEIIGMLITENFLNEERFAKIYAGSKFRVKQWGRIKIQKALEARGLSPYCVRLGLAEIDPEDYYQTLYDLAQKKWTSLDGEPPAQRKQKTWRFLAQKGYENTHIWEIIGEIAAQAAN